MVTSKIFRTVYECVKSCLAFSELSNLVTLQELNGVEMGSMLTSHVAGASIAQHIASDMRKELVLYLLESRSKFSILVDESTSVSQEQAMVVYIRTQFENIACNFFFDLVPVVSASADALYKSLIGCLENAGLSIEVLKQQLIGFCSDGASNMTGKVKGLATLLRQTVGEHLQLFHCLAHRLELAVNSTVNDLNPVSHFQSFLDGLYAFYSRSPKNQRELELNAGRLCLELLKVGRVFDVRWVFSSFRAVKALWRDHPALCSHFKAAADDASRTSAERSKVKGMLVKLTTWHFMAELAMIALNARTFFVFTKRKCISC